MAFIERIVRARELKEYGDLIGRLRVAVPKMVLEVGGSPTE
jgi:hypothetical protein